MEGRQPTSSPSARVRPAGGTARPLPALAKAQISRLGSAPRLQCVQAPQLCPAADDARPSASWPASFPHFPEDLKQACAALSPEQRQILAREVDRLLGEQK